MWITTESAHLIRPEIIARDSVWWWRHAVYLPCSRFTVMQAKLHIPFRLHAVDALLVFAAVNSKGFICNRQSNASLYVFKSSRCLPLRTFMENVALTYVRYLFGGSNPRKMQLCCGWAAVLKWCTDQQSCRKFPGLQKKKKRWESSRFLIWHLSVIKGAGKSEGSIPTRREGLTLC